MKESHQGYGYAYKLNYKTLDSHLTFKMLNLFYYCLKYCINWVCEHPIIIFEMNRMFYNWLCMYIRNTSCDFFSLNFFCFIIGQNKLGPKSLNLEKTNLHVFIVLWSIEISLLNAKHALKKMERYLVRIILFSYSNSDFKVKKHMSSSHASLWLTVWKIQFIELIWISKYRFRFFGH